MSDDPNRMLFNHLKATLQMVRKTINTLESLSLYQNGNRNESARKLATIKYRQRGRQVLIRTSELQSHYKKKQLVLEYTKKKASHDELMSKCLRQQKSNMEGEGQKKSS